MRTCSSVLGLPNRLVYRIIQPVTSKTNMRKLILCTVSCLVVVLLLIAPPDTPKPPADIPLPPAPVDEPVALGVDAPSVAVADEKPSVTAPPEHPPAAARERLAADYVADEHGQQQPVRTYRALTLPNDPNTNQWWVGSTGIEAAWNLGQGEQVTTLAVIDTGFALAHEEFSGRLHTNSGEIGAAGSENPSRYNCSDQSKPLDASCNLVDDDFDGVVDNESGTVDVEHTSQLNCSEQAKPLDKSCNLIDDDGNGLVDDAHGFDFVNFDRSPQVGETNPSGDGTTHGTAVMGIAAATGNNNMGIAGVDWYSRLLPLQAMDDDEYGNTISVGRAIRYAADQGANVISLSLGTEGHDQFVRDAVAYAIAKGSMVVAAAGNDGCECLLYPASYEEVVAVGAINTSSQPASFSSYGATLDVLAPGVSMQSAYWSPTDQTTAYASGLAGTSFAAPYVAGLLSLIKSHLPQATTHQLIGLLTAHTDRSALASSEVRSATLGYGLVRADQVVDRLASPQSPTIRYAMRSVSQGTKLGSYEVAGTAQVHQCESARPGSTTVYRLSRGSEVFYTLSHIENYEAEAAGYASSVFSPGLCIDLPTDQPSMLRLLSIAAEFENRSVIKY